MSYRERVRAVAQGDVWRGRRHGDEDRTVEVLDVTGRDRVHIRRQNGAETVISLKTLRGDYTYFGQVREVPTWATWQPS